jgi:hypothetical protein
LYVVILLAFSWMGNFGWGASLIAMFALEWFYPVIFELHNGATPGKRVMGICVRHDDGTPLNWQSAMLRNLLRVADFLPFCYALGLVSMLINRQFKRLGDLAAGTVVIYDQTAAPHIGIPAADPLPLPQPLTVEEQRAILDFAERHGQLSVARKAELANLLGSYSGRHDETATQTLYRYATWIQRGQ